MNKLSSMLTFLINKIGNTTLGTAATTITGAIAEVFAKASKTETDLSEYMIRIALNTGEHSTAAGTGTINYNYTISDEAIPAGYKPFEVRCATNGGAAGWYNFYPCACDFVDGTNNMTVNLRFQDRNGNPGTLYPWIVVTCIKDLS